MVPTMSAVPPRPGMGPGMGGNPGSPAPRPEGKGPQPGQPRAAGEIWQHPTISRDSTRGSRFQQEQLAALQQPGANSPQAPNPPGPSERSKTSLGQTRPPPGLRVPAEPGRRVKDGSLVNWMAGKPVARKSAKTGSSGSEESSGSDVESDDSDSARKKKRRDRRSRRSRGSDESRSRSRSRSRSSADGFSNIDGSSNSGSGSSRSEALEDGSRKVSVEHRRKNRRRHGRSSARHRREPIDPAGCQPQATTDRIKMLEAELEGLRMGTVVPDSGINGWPDADDASSSFKPGKWKTLYRISKRKRLYLGEPEWMPAERGIKLRASMPLKDFDLYLERHPEIPFIVYKDYLSSHFDDAAHAGLDDGELDPDVLPPPRPTSESISLISPHMIAAVEDLIATYDDFSKVFPRFNIEAEIPAPYNFLYHMYPKLHANIARLARPAQDHLAVLMEFLGESYLPRYQKVIESMDEGIITADQVPFLVRPGDVLVRMDPEPQAFVSYGWLVEQPMPDSLHSARKAKRVGAGDDGDESDGPSKGMMAQRRRKLTDGDGKEGDREGDKDGNQDAGGNDAADDEEENDDGDRNSAHRTRFMVYTVVAWRWNNKNDAFVNRINVPLALSVSTRKGAVLRITDQKWFPLRYASAEVVELLRTRGRRFLSFSKQQIVGYEAVADEGLEVANERYIIDFPTYKKLHQSSLNVVRPSMSAAYIPLHNLDAMIGRNDNDERLLVFPRQITGYNLRLKRWVDVFVDRITDVNWNKKAFENLVIDTDTKHLVKALISNQIKSEKATDLISGKGNGLIILLHGGPGTGKTFTAESVAELAEKPLYRVTCGDIGTKPEDVEQYLESVLYLGKIWGCVVLLDEADVFLEERSLTDLQRNALVSVFLRVLEYYDGILILTSNRVGIFDQAFKSRIQLALHYENLSKPQRRKIWRNFFNRLRDLGEECVDYDDLYDHIDDLAEEEMNGRQIRNAITTARQLSQFDGRDFAYEQLRHVIRVAGRFEGYLKSVNHGFTDDQLARESGVR